MVREEEEEEEEEEVFDCKKMFLYIKIKMNGGESGGRGRDGIR